MYLVYLSCLAIFKANYLAALVFLISSGQLEKWKPTSSFFPISLMKVMCIQLDKSLCIHQRDTVLLLMKLVKCPLEEFYFLNGE